MSSLPPEILELRQRAHHGGRIDEHRAFRRIADRTRISWSAVLTVAALVTIVILLLPAIAMLWQRMIEFAAPAMGITGGVATQPRNVLPFVNVIVPYLPTAAPLPSASLLTGTAVVMVLMFVASWLIPRRYLPFVYLLRMGIIIQVVSVGYFAFFGERFPYTLARYTLDMHTVGLAVVALVPVIFGLTYFVFDFGITRKVAIVVITIAHLIVFMPLQYLLHAAIVKVASMLFLPVLFMFFGLLLDVSVLIAMYGWAMSWRDRAERIAQPARML
jgi:hypothetical protein